MLHGVLCRRARGTKNKQVAQLSQRNRAAGWISFWWVVGDGVGQSGANVVGSREEVPLNSVSVLQAIGTHCKKRIDEQHSLASG